MATISKRGKVWRAQVRIAGRYFSESFHSRQTAQQWAREKEDAIRLGTVDAVPALTVRAAIDKYEMERREHRPLSATIRGNLTRWQESLGDRDFATLTAGDVVQHAKDRACGPATMAMEVGALRDVYTVARTWGIRPALHPIDEAMPTLRKFRLIADSKERDRRPTEDELTRLRVYLFANKRLPMRDLLDFAIASAMRVSEVTRITWADFDADKRTVIVRDRKDPQEKDGNDQAVPLIGDAFTIVDRQPRNDGRIFPFHEDSITRCFRSACKSLGIVNLHWHDFRHEGISRLFEAGYQIHEVAVVSGHRDWKSLKRYANLRPELLHRDSAPLVGST
jgi:integrase